MINIILFFSLGAIGCVSLLLGGLIIFIGEAISDNILISNIGYGMMALGVVCLGLFAILFVCIGFYGMLSSF